MIKCLLAVFFGGGFGSLARYGIQMWMHERIVCYNLPWATFSVNIAGSFMIGLFYALSSRLNISPEIRLLLTAGFCGGFTTFSTFSNDNIELMRQGDWMLCLVYTFSSIILGFAACFAGGWIASK